MLSIPKLRALVAVAEQGSFRTAAKAAGLSAASLSTSVSDLERELNVRLMQRTTRRVQLTPEGQRLFDRARRVLAELESISDDLTADADAPRGRVTVSCVPTLAATVFAEVLGGFCAVHPTVVIEIIDEPSEAAKQRVLKGEADFAIGTPAGAELTFQRLVNDPFVLTCRPDDALARADSVTGKQLLQLPIITLIRGSAVRTTLDAYYERFGAVLHPRFEVRHHFTLGGLVHAGLGYAPLPSLALPLTGSPLAAIPIRRPNCERSIGILTRPGDKLSLPAKALADFVRPFFLRDGRRRGLA
jgi:LysR family transcriptional regulator, carnitine catabolism transcriptional activator